MAESRVRGAGLRPGSLRPRLLRRRGAPPLDRGPGRRPSRPHRPLRARPPGGAGLEPADPRLSQGRRGPAQRGRPRSAQGGRRDPGRRPGGQDRGFGGRPDRLSTERPGPRGRHGGDGRVRLERRRPHRHARHRAQGRTSPHHRPARRRERGLVSTPTAIRPSPTVTRSPSTRHKARRSTRSIPSPIRS